MNTEVLRNIGLTESEINIYLDIVRHEDSLVSEISNRVRISRTYIYDSIQNLVNKGLVTYVIKNNRRYYKALEPEKLLEYLDDRAAEIQRQRKGVQSLVSGIKVLQTSKLKKPIVEVFEGKEGLKTVLNDILNQGKDIVAWGATDRIKDYLPAWFLERYVQEKAKRRIKTKQFYVKGEKTLDGLGYILKPVSKELSSPVTFAAYDDRTIIFFWSEIPFVVRVINKEIADSFKKHFEFLWKKIKL